MIVKRLEWLSEPSREAALTISDGEFECVAFCHPCEVGLGARLQEPLLAISIRGVIKGNEETPCAVERLSADGFAHEVRAKVADITKRLVTVGKIVIEMDDFLPGDIDVGNSVSFVCGRLDVIA